MNLHLKTPRDTMLTIGYRGTSVLAMLFGSLILAGSIPTWIALGHDSTLVDEDQATSSTSAEVHQRAHAHNDYAHDRPLLDALEYGFCSVEADIFLIDDQLLVGHDRSQLAPERTLQKLYLEPLRSRVSKHDGRVFPRGPTFQLLIDIKSEGRSTYLRLSEVLQGYSAMLTAGPENESVRAPAVRVVISGNREFQTIMNDPRRLVGIDGRVSDLGGSHSAELMPLISDHWHTHFRWDGTGMMPESEQRNLRSIVERAHSAGQEVRFWATPEQRTLWKELVEADVDYINTDDLRGLAEFLDKTDSLEPQ